MESNMTMDGWNYDDCMSAWTSLGHILLPIAERDSELRETLRSRVARLLERLRPENVEAVEPDAPSAHPDLPAGELSFKTLTIGNASVEVPVHIEPGQEVPDSGDETDAPPIPQPVPARPAERDWTVALRVAAERSRIRAKDSDLCEPHARAHANLATALEIILRVPSWASGDSRPDRDLLQGVAESQSALRGASLNARSGIDASQQTAFEWLNEMTSRHSVRLPQFMRKSDVADPAVWEERVERLSNLDRRVRQGRARKRLLKKLEYKLGRLERAADEGDRCKEWGCIMRTLCEWLDAGLLANDKDLCEKLVPFIEGRPEALVVPTDAEPVLAAVDDRISRRSARASASLAESTASTATPELLEARRLLQGRVVCLVGGQCREQERQRLECDLGLEELRWIPTAPHKSLDPLVTQIQRPEVDLVMVAVKFADHAFAQLSGYARAAGKVFIKLPAGYGTNQVAHQVVGQASDRLARLPNRD